MWMGFLEDASAHLEPPSTSLHLWLRTLARTILPKLVQDGFATPSRRSLVSSLESGLEPLETATSKSNRNWGQVCSFAHFLKLLWDPVIDHIEALSRDEDPQWTESLGRNQAAILSEMRGIVSCADESVGMDPWVEFVQSTLARLLRVHVPTRLIMQVVAPIVPLTLEPTPANAMHLLRSSLCAKLVGPALAAQANRMILAEISEVPVKLFPEEHLHLEVRKDLIAALEEQHCEPEEDITDTARPCKKHRKDPKSKDEALANKTKQVLWMLENRVASSRVCETLSNAAALISSWASSSSSASTPLSRQKSSMAESLSEGTSCSWMPL